MSAEVGIVCGACDWFNSRDGTSCESCGSSLELIPAGAPEEEAPAAQVAAPDDEAQVATADEVAETLPVGAGPESEELAEEDSVEIPEASDDEVELGATLAAEPGEVGAWEPTLPAAEDPDSAVTADVDLTELLESEEAPEAPAEEEEEETAVIVVEPVVIGPPGGIEKEELQMEQARHYICKSCYSPIPGGHKFCGKCGAPTNFTEESTTTQYFGAMQVPGKAKLILIRGEGLDGISYHLNSTEHVAGRQQGAILFPDDNWLSPRHANFFYRDNKLFVRDEESVNGVYCRVSGPTPLSSGSTFMCGEQHFRVEMADPVAEGPEADGTYFYASPSKAWSFRVIQILRGGMAGNTVHDDGGQVVIGREDCQMNFPTDPYLDPKHAKVQQEGGQMTLTDMGTMNGTFLRIQQEKELVHGDYVFLGKQLLRVEVTP